MDITKTEHKIKYNTPVNIYFLSDIHYGQAGVEKKALNQAVADIANDDSGLVVLCGDLIDAIVPLGDKRFNPNEIDAQYSIQDLEELPKMQADDILKVLEPIKSKIIVSVSGNHEDKFTQYHGFNPAKYIANRLEVELINYIGFHVMSFDVGGHMEKLVLHLNHGNGGGGKSAGAAKNTIDDLARFFDADICAFAHIHKLEILHNTVVGVNASGTALKRKKQLSICTGCFLRTYTENENYFAHKGRRESDVGYIKATVSFDNNDKKAWRKKISAQEVRF